jgi:predicted branched-subunit amino acid permease
MEIIKKAFYKSVPVMAGYLILGIGFGILMDNAGYGVLWSFAMALFIYAGSMQYVGISLLTGPASIITTALTTFMVNARHLFYSISMVDRYKDAGKYKPYLIFGLTDETYSLLSVDDEPGLGADDEPGHGADGGPGLGLDDGSRVNEDGKAGITSKDLNRYRFFVTLFDHSYWVTGCVLGSVVGSFLPFSTEGIEFSMTALFIASYTEQWLKTRDHIPALTGFFGTLICLVIFGPDRFLIPAMVLITAVLTILRNRLEESGAADAQAGSGRGAADAQAGSESGTADAQAGSESGSEEAPMASAKGNRKEDAK